jgi:predicted nicotinamide N-methyase
VTASPGEPHADRHRDWEQFIRDNTRLIAPPLVPELRLYLAEESLPIWRRTEEELGAMNVPPPYWAFAWAGGQALARYLLDNPQLVRGHRVLDLGAGSGLGGIAAMRAGAKEALIADIDSVSLVAARLNADANDISVKTTNDDLLTASELADFSVVLIGDLFYERALAELVVAFIDRVTAAGALVLIGDPQRSYFPKGRFTETAQYSVPVTRELEDAEIKRTSVWRAGAVT